VIGDHCSSSGSTVPFDPSFIGKLKMYLSPQGMRVVGEGASQEVTHAPRDSKSVAAFGMKRLELLYLVASGMRPADDRFDLCPAARLLGRVDERVLDR
jgi:hypothetical protein